MKNTHPTFANISFVFLLIGKGIPQTHDHLTHRQHTRRKGEASNALAQRRERCQDVQNFLGQESCGSEIKSGDNKTPEGKYTIEKHNPKSIFHLSLKISYPNAEQIKAAKEGNYEPGGDIMIHGYPNKIPAFLFKFWHKWKDWTAGCIAVTNDEIEEIYDAIKDGTPITILP